MEQRRSDPAGQSGQEENYRNRPRDNRCKENCYFTQIILNWNWKSLIQFVLNNKVLEVNKFCIYMYTQFLLYKRIQPILKNPIFILQFQKNDPRNHEKQPKLEKKSTMLHKRT